MRQVVACMARAGNAVCSSPVGCLKTGALSAGEFAASALRSLLFQL
jgi:hypothetical protein